MKGKRPFLCKKVNHRTMNCQKQKPQSHHTIDCLISKQISISKLSVSRMTMQKSEQKKPHAEKLSAEKPVIVLSSLLPYGFFAEEALVALCTLGNCNKGMTTVFLDTEATRYLSVNLAMAQLICDKLVIKLI